MKKLISACIVAGLFISATFAEWEPSIVGGMSFPVFNQTIRSDDDDDGDDSKVKGTGIDFDIQGRFINLDNNISLLLGYNVGYLSVKASEFLADDDVSGNFAGVNQNILGGIGYRLVNTDTIQLVASGVIGVTFLNLASRIKYYDSDDNDSLYSINMDCTYTSTDVGLGADIFAAYKFNKHLGIAASITGLCTVASYAKFEAKAKLYGISISDDSDGKIKNGSFTFVPRFAVVYTF